MQAESHRANYLSRECLHLSCLPEPSFADMACRVGDMSATCLWSCRRHKKMLCRPWGQNDTTFEDMSRHVFKCLQFRDCCLSSNTKTLW